MLFKPYNSKGFTLVELLIVVIILAILAAIVVPQFASSTDDAKIAALDSTLASVRSAIDLYYQQHRGRYPGSYSKDDGTTATTTDAERIAAFKAQLSLFTDANGKTNNAKTSVYKYGPYLKKADLPANPVTNVATLVTVNTGTLPLAGGGANGGWRLDVVTGQFIADDTTLDPNGIGYDKH